MYKLSPSDFAYLYEDCKHCYCLKVKNGIYQPSMPMPGVFAAINTRLQGALVGQDLKTLSRTLPEGIVESQEGFVESVPVPDTNIYLKGKYDLLVRQPNGSYMLIDFKISQPHEDKIAKYQTQLEAYKFAFEHPASGEPLIIARMGLIVMYPDTVKFENDTAYLDFPPRWLEISPNPEAFKSFVLEVNNLLEGPMPPESPECKWCKYRHLGERLSHPDADVVDF